ncbi:MAG: RagB/SusD family nutrient uptake outer membrane protein [Draconibacterium sp.]
MKKFKIYSYMLAVVFVFLGVGCQDFLKEESVTDITANSYIVNEAGYEDLVKACYPALRDIILQFPLVLHGTDIFQGSNWNEKVVGDGSALDQYDVRYNSSLAELESFWNLLYLEIGRTNSAIERSENIEYSDPAKKIIRVSEAKFLRALSYFYLVQTWGDVPMPLVETITPDKNVVRVPAADVYTQIIKDLTEAEAALPATATDYGRVTKGAVQFLLARVYLTRGWNFNNSLGGSAADFNTALSYADKVIAAYPLVPQYSSLFPKRSKNPLNQYTGAQNAKNSEVVFAIQYSGDLLTNGNAIDGGTPGNWYHSIFPGQEGLVGNPGRTSDYNRFQPRNVPSPSAYRLFDPQKDSRYEHDFLEVIYALKKVTDYAYSYTDPDAKVSYNVGDTVAYWTPWNKPASGADKGIDEGGTKNYAVMNLDQEISGVLASRLTATPITTFKFWEPNIEYGDGYGTFDFALFRSAEAYLIAAEAIVKGATGGALGGAENYYNKLIDRAVGEGIDPLCAKYPEDITSMETVSYRATASNISVDLILDESARELFGEFNRWFDLKRTGKLIERTKRMNFWTKNKGNLDEHHLLRPIPQSEIDRTDPPISQNSGY